MRNRAFALTMNPISTTNFKFAIGNLPIKVSRDDDMLFSFRNQVVGNIPIKDNEINQIPECITKRHGEIEYLLTNIEENMNNFYNDFKMWLDGLDIDSDNESEFCFNPIQEINIQQNNIIIDSLYEIDDESVVTLLDVAENLEVDHHQSEEFSNQPKLFRKSRINEDLQSKQLGNSHNEKIFECKSNQSIDRQNSKSKSIDPEKDILSIKIVESCLNLASVDHPKNLSNNTPKTKNKKIKPQVSIFKSAKSTRTTIHSSKRSSKAKLNQNPKTADRQIRK